MTQRRLLLLASLVLAPRSLWACAACYGHSDSPLAAGMNWGIFTLLGTVLFVLIGFAAFFIFLARRSAAVSVAEAPLLPELNDLDAPCPTGKSSAHLCVFPASLPQPLPSH